jgi:hypothetical protein
MLYLERFVFKLIALLCVIWFYHILRKAITIKKILFIALIILLLSRVYYVLI